MFLKTTQNEVFHFSLPILQEVDCHLPLFRRNAPIDHRIYRIRNDPIVQAFYPIHPRFKMRIGSQVWQQAMFRSASNPLIGDCDSVSQCFKSNNSTELSTSKQGIVMVKYSHRFWCEYFVYSEIFFMPIFVCDLGIKDDDARTQKWQMLHAQFWQNRWKTHAGRIEVE